ncbi:MAG: cell filamentation protein Fic, partial [Prevotella denticola]
PKTVMTVKEVENRFSVSHTTAKSDLDGLVTQQFLKKIPVNKVKSSYVKGELFDSKTGLE